MKKIKYILISFLLSFPVIAGAHVGSELEQDYNSMYSGGGMMGFGGAWTFLGIAGHLILLAIGILLIVWLWEKIKSNK